MAIVDWFKILRNLNFEPISALRAFHRDEEDVETTDGVLLRGFNARVAVCEASKGPEFEFARGLDFGGLFLNFFLEPRQRPGGRKEGRARLAGVRRSVLRSPRLEMRILEIRIWGPLL